MYNETEPIELTDEELYIMGVDEPSCYNQAVKGNEWRKAMKVEIDAIEMNNT